MTAYSYKSIKSPVETIFKEKGSKFLTFAFPVENEFQIKSHLAELQKRYFDASHHCYAFSLGPEPSIQKAHDAGEPNHTAGTPILSQIRSFQLTNILIVVVRYFGGTKLGASGLIKAYKTSAYEVLSLAEIITKEVTVFYKVQFAYVAMNLVMKIIKDQGIDIIKQDFSENTCNIEIDVKKKVEQEVLGQLKKIDDLNRASLKID